MAIKRWVSVSSTDFATAGNWLPSGVPASNDTVLFDGTGTANVEQNLDQSAKTGITLIVTHANAARIGTDTGGTATYLKIGATSAVIGQDDGGSGTGSQLLLLDFNVAGNANVTTVYRSATSGYNTKYPPVSIKGGTATGASLTLSVNGGKVGIGLRPSETATATVRVAKGGNSNPEVFIGSGVTLTELTVDAGSVQTSSDQTATVIRVSGGEVVYRGTGAITTLNLDEGKFYYEGTGTIGTANVRGTLDASRDGKAKTITTLKCYRGFSVNLDNGIPAGVAITNAVEFPDGLTAGTFTTPQGVKATLAAI